MAPKKKVDKTSKPAKCFGPKEKVSKKKVKEEKPESKSSDIVKYLSRTLKPLLSDVPDPTINPKKRKSKEDKATKLCEGKQRQIELANEVALDQVVKPSDIQETSLPEKAATAYRRKSKKQKPSHTTNAIEAADVPGPTITSRKRKLKEENATELYNGTQKQIELANEVALTNLAMPGDSIEPSVPEKAATVKIRRSKKQKLSEATTTNTIKASDAPDPTISSRKHQSKEEKATKLYNGTERKIELANKVALIHLAKPGDSIEPSVPEKAATVKIRRPKKQKASEAANTIKVSDVPDPTISSRKHQSKEEKATQLCNGTKRKIELANEVALFQLMKSSDRMEPTVPEKAATLKRSYKKHKFSEATNTIKVAQAQFVKPSDVIEPSVPEKGATQKRRRSKTQKLSEATDTVEVVRVELERQLPDVEVVKEKRGRKKSDKATEATCAANKSNADLPAKNSTKQRKNTKLKTVKPIESELPKENKNISQIIKLKRSKRQVTTSENVPSTDNHDLPSILEQTKETNSIKDDIVREKPGLSVNHSPVVFHKVSPTNSCEGLSWTKDISASSTTTGLTVSSKDFVRFGKKMPVIKLSNIVNELMESVNNDDKYSDISDSESCGNSAKYSSKHSPAFNEKCDSRSLGLTTSSTSPAKSNNLIYAHENTSQSSINDVNKSKIGFVFDKLASKLKLLDLEHIEWIGRNNNKNTNFHDKFQEKLLILKDENNLFMECQNLRTILSSSNSTDSCESINYPANNIDEQTRDGVTADNINEETHVETDSMHIGEIDLKNRKESNDADNLSENKARYSQLQQNFSNNDDRLQSPVPNENFENDNCTSKMFEHIDTRHDSNEDDDALSLFAESITGIEPSKFNSTVAAKHVGPAKFEKYVPRPLKVDFLKQNVSYVPTKITNKSNENVTENAKTNAVCEKQNADSTSIYKESEETATSPALQLENAEYDPVNESGATATSPKCPVSSPASFAQKWRGSINSYSQCSFAKSSVFRGVCFFNLANRCKNVSCAFPHYPIEAITVKERLQKLSIDSFIQEYLLMRSYPDLKAAYGQYFIKECYARGFTRILIEMAKEFIDTAKDHVPDEISLKINVIEHALLLLNDVDLRVCDDLLMLSTSSTAYVRRNQSKQLLCDVFMKTIAESQNFSRFKSVFTKLTLFMVNKNRTFSVDVAALILERVCILPGDLPLARALLNIIKNTDESIFHNSMIEKLEGKILALDKNLYDEFLSLKKKVQKNQAAHGGKQQLCFVQGDREQRYMSPDSTKLDNLNKAVVVGGGEPQRMSVFKSPQQSLNNSKTSSTSNTSAEDYRPAPKRHKFENSRRGRHNFNNTFQMRTAMPQLRPAMPQLRPMGHMMPPPMYNNHSQERRVVYRQPLRRRYDYQHGMS